MHGHTLKLKIKPTDIHLRMHRATEDSRLLHECLGGAEQDQEMTLTAHHKDRIDRGLVILPHLQQITE